MANCGQIFCIATTSSKRFAPVIRCGAHSVYTTARASQLAKSHITPFYIRRRPIITGTRKLMTQCLHVEGVARRLVEFEKSDGRLSTCRLSPFYKSTVEAISRPFWRQVDKELNMFDSFDKSNVPATCRTRVFKADDTLTMSPSFDLSSVAFLHVERRR